MSRVPGVVRRWHVRTSTQLGGMSPLLPIGLAGLLLAVAMLIEDRPVPAAVIGAVGVVALGLRALLGGDEDDPVEDVDPP